MRRISRPSTCDRGRRPARRRRGFTLIEALFALAIAALLCGAVAAGLTVLHRERQDEVRCRELSLSLRGVTARRLLGDKPFASATNAVGPVSEETEKSDIKEGERRRMWEIWTASAADRPSRRVRIGFPDSAGGEDREAAPGVPTEDGETPAAKPEAPPAPGAGPAPAPR